MMTRPTKFAIASIIVVLALSAARLRGYRAEKDDEDSENEELIEKAEAALSTLGPGGCGVERWSVKTLSDRDAGQVNLSPVDATIGGLTTTPGNSPWGAFDATPTAHQMPPDARTMSGDYAENQVYRVRGVLLRYKLESDRDYHLVVEDPSTGQTMVVESADPSCPGANVSSRASDLVNVRSQFQADIGASHGAPGPQFIEAGRIPVTITGVRFFDHLHGQNGGAPNGGELHPILCVSAGGGCG